jgi:hypothetical protein
MSNPSKKNYIDNVRFSKEAAKHAELFRYNRANGLAPPKMNDYLGKCILLLATKISSMPCFSGYSFRDEFVSDGIEIAIRYFYNYNPEVISERTGKPSAGAYAFFSQIMIRRFFKTRQENKLQMFIREKYIASSDDSFADMQGQDAEEHSEALKEVLGEMSGHGYIEHDTKVAIKKAELKAKQLTKKELNMVAKLDTVLPMAAFF